MSKRKSSGSGGRKRRPDKRDSTPAPDGSFELRLKAMAHGGSAIGFHQGRTAFVPYTIPGERIRARIVRSERSVDFAEGVQMLEASADRVFPQCPHFGPGRCWGCQWQHIDYAAQLLIKQDVLVDQLARLGGFKDAILDPAIRPVIASPDIWGYNYHIRYETTPEGQLGLARTDGRSIEPISVCHVLHPELQALYEQIELDFSGIQALSLYRGSDAATMILLHMRDEEAPELSADFSTSANALLPDNEPVNLFGDTVVNYHVAGHTLRMTAGGFFRANVPQVETLARVVHELLDPQPDDAVLDLYAGVGVFSAAIAPHVRMVTLVESYPPMATDADVNLADADNIDIIEGSVEDVLRTMAEEEAQYDAAILDPPASGLSRAAMEALLPMKLKRLIVISSNPATLARDGKTLAAAGYRLTHLQPLDFAPQTYYIDTVARFERRA